MCFYVFIIAKSFKEPFFFINTEFTLDLMNLYLFYITIMILAMCISKNIYISVINKNK